MNILIIARGIPSKQDPQWGSFEFDQAKALKALGHQVTIASVDTRLRLYWRTIGLTRGMIDGIKTYNIFFLPGKIVRILGSSMFNRYNAWLWHKIEKVLLKDEKFDIIYTHYLPKTHSAIRYLQHINAPIVAIEHWSEVNQSTLRPHVKKMGDEAYPKVDRLITVSYAARKSIMHHFAIDSTVVYNMVDSSFRYDVKLLKKNNDKFIFTAVGNLLPIKGYDTLIHACAKVAIPRNKWELRIAGHGKSKSYMSSLITKYGLQENITLVGQKDKAGIVDLLNQSDAFVLASRSETFGVVYIEAMACGLPIIATRCGGPEEFVNEKNGLLVPVDDVDALATAIKYMYEHYPNYNRQAIADDCKARFSSEVIAKQLTEIFEDVIAKNTINS